MSRWLWLDCRHVSNFNPVGWWIPHVSLHLGLIKAKNLFLKVKYLSDDFMIFPKLFQSFKYMEKKNSYKVRFQFENLEKVKNILQIFVAKTLNYCLSFIGLIPDSLCNFVWEIRFIAPFIASAAWCLIESIF